MLQINNNTPFSVELHPCSDIYGRDYAVIVIKATYQIDYSKSQLVIANEQAPIQHADHFYNEPGQSSVKYPSDISLVKQATDVLVIGHAYVPNQHAARVLDITLSIDNFKKTIRIFGDRVWQKDLANWTMSVPTEFTIMPLCYENSYGGKSPNINQNMAPESVEAYRYNPFGKGFVGNKDKPYEGMPLPNIEDPSCLLMTPFQHPTPAGFGAIARDWEPRLAFSGTYDEQWQAERMPLLPLDFHPVFFNSAHPELMIQPLLKGGEQVSINNMSPTMGDYSFIVPNIKLSVAVSIRKQEKTFIAQMDTLLIEPDENRVIVTYRVAVPCTRKLLYIDSITVNRLS